MPRACKSSLSEQRRGGSCQQDWAANSTPSIYQWHLPVFPGMANKAQVGNTGKYNFFAAKYWHI